MKNLKPNSPPTSSSGLIGRSTEPFCAHPVKPYNYDKALILLSHNNILLRKLYYGRDFPKSSTLKIYQIQVKKKYGFTLLEILIALFIFAIIASISTTILTKTMQIEERTSKHSKQIKKLQLSYILLERDTMQIIERPVRGNQMHLFPSFIGQKDYLEFTKGGNVNPDSKEKRSTLQRVAYMCKNNKLIRRIWDELDTPDRNKYHDTALLDNLKHCSFSYMGLHQNILPTWYQNNSNDKNLNTPLPQAILLKIKIEKLGQSELRFKI